MDAISQQRINDQIEQRLRQLEQLTANIPVRFSAATGPNYPAGIIKVTGKFTNGGAGTNGGFYTGLAVRGTADSAGNDAQKTNNNLTMPEGMVVDTSDNLVIVMNLAEDTLSSHNLTIPSYPIGIRVGTYIKDNGSGKKLPSGDRLFAGQTTDVWAISPGGSLPAPTGLYKCLMQIDTAKTIGWDYPRFVTPS